MILNAAPHHCADDQCSLEPVPRLATELCTLFQSLIKELHSPFCCPPPPDTAQMTNVRWNLFHIFLVIPVSLLKALAKKSAMFEDLVLLELEGDAAQGQQVRGERYRGTLMRGWREAGAAGGGGGENVKGGEGADGA